MTKSDKITAIFEEFKKLHPISIDLSLDRIQILLDRLGRPQDRLPPTIHVAGTNGKGSTIAFLKAMLIGNGKSVHTYTSPHLVHFNERIHLANSKSKTLPIDDNLLAEILQHVIRINNKEPITFFEMTTAAAFMAFSEIQADFLLLEVGLGGRFDATNVISKPRCSIITPVSIDHSDKLGSTLELIAFEKAGILKPGIPAVIGPQDPASMTSIKQTSQRVGSPLYCYGQNYLVFEEHSRLIFQSEQRLIDLPLPVLIGRNQIFNAGVAIATTLLLTDGYINTEALEYGLTKAKWPARFMRLRGEPFASWIEHETEIWLDGGHNPGASSAIAQTLADLQDRTFKPIYLITGLLNNKDAQNFFKPFLGLVKEIHTVPIPNSTMAMDTKLLANHAKSAGLTTFTANDVRSAITSIEESQDGPKRILVCGSLHLAGSILAESDTDFFA
ncbi:MAG: Folylpolyglutamate synthase [Hyphomicrobiaceae bacterium hypho_1]